MHKNSLYLTIGVISLSALIFLFGNAPMVSQAASQAVTGYAWSDTIGWIHFNPSLGGVFLDTATGVFSGYAWSDNIGWVDFSPTSGFPETPSYGAKMDTSTGKITGWTKAVAGGSAEAGGWDGWIKMSDGTYSVNVNLNTGDFSGYAWGSDVVGWISFSGTGYKVSTGVIATPTLNVTLSANPSSGIAPLNDVDLTAVVSGTETGTINYTFYCNRSDAGTNITLPYDAKYDGESVTTKTATDICDYSSAGTYTAKVIVERGTSVAENRTTIDVQGIPECSDGIDNDANGCADYPADTGCTSSSDTTESGGICIAQPDFSLTAEPSSITVTLVEGGPAETFTSVIKVLPQNGFNEDVSLSVKSINPALAGESHSLSDSVLSSLEYSTGSVFSITIPTATSEALYTVTIQGDGTTISGRTTEIELDVKSYEWWPCQMPDCPSE